MSRFDYRDPGVDPLYCDAISTRIVVCAHCHGTGEIRTDDDGPQDCHLCGGDGYYEEDSRD